ncbi:trypsin-like serine protease [Streptomyces sp. BHT-5-2]|uniref:S1 family peptidase n=1 Tax=Streptomyces sp. BHT-5-2 TaxID=2866715 RepID=UPI001C8E211A|nr:trypsin-like serine protease [Streptomyces sp. BHT-5-2]QZL06371.1 trypsin-like serine protease [Streptomyces sp. BHT-5-2]
MATKPPSSNSASRADRPPLGAGLLTAAPANAVAGSSTKEGSYAFTAKFGIGGIRSCSAALVEKQWLVTAASCFADNPAQGFRIRAGAPKSRTTAIIGRTDPSQESGSVVDVAELVPREDRDLVTARLAKPVTGIAPVDVGRKAPETGENLWVSGYGRTAEEWVPDLLHHAKFAVDSVKDTSVGLSGTSDDPGVCKGDTGGPAFRGADGRFELAAVNSTSWQGGCLGNRQETRMEQRRTDQCR